MSLHLKYEYDATELGGTLFHRSAVVGQARVKLIPALPTYRGGGPHTTS
jgi:hypothetical protein